MNTLDKDTYPLTTSEMNSVLIAVVVFNPSEEQMNNLESLGGIGFEFVIFQNSALTADQSGDYEILGDGENVGVAAAYNRIFGHATQRQKPYVLLLDQDTDYTDSERFKLNVRSLLTEFSCNARLAAVGMNYSVNQISDQITPYILTSGTLYKTSAVIAVQGFREELFIDEVEIQTHMVLMINGYAVLSKFDYKMDHTVGDPLELKIGIVKIRTTNHAPIRRYYMTRIRLNTKWVMRRHSIDVRPAVKSVIFEALRIVLLERQKVKKLYFMARGVFDFIRGKYGKYD